MALNHMIAFSEAKGGKKMKPVRSSGRKPEVPAAEVRKERTAPPSVRKAPAGGKRGRPSGSPYADRVAVLIKFDPAAVSWLDDEYVRRRLPSRADLVRALVDEAKK